MPIKSIPTVRIVRLMTRELYTDGPRQNSV
jgi:hypothetical protein